MYVYKKKCEEDYYISLIQFTQQQYINQVRSEYPFGQIYPSQYKASYQPNSSNYFNQANDNYCYKTPKRKKSFQIYKDFSNNGENGQFIQEQNEFYNMKKNGNGNDNESKGSELYHNFGCNNELIYKNFGKNKTEMINKKIFRLEDFLTESKMKGAYDHKRSKF
jgi:hypothetical protein